MALWAEAATGLPLLPSDFWEVTFPAPGGPDSGPLDESTGWHFVDPNHAIQKVAEVKPELPEVVSFDWCVPQNAADHSCILALVESDDDPIPMSVRTQNELRPWVLIPEVHQIGLRNVHVVDAPNSLIRYARFIGVGYRNLLPGVGPQRLLISRADFEPSDTVTVLLPRTPGLSLRNVDSLRVHLSQEDRAAALALGLDTTRVYRVRPPEGEIRGLTVHADTFSHIGVRLATAGTSRRRLASRVVIRAMQDSVLVGGSTYVLRFRQ